jgi:hypothetical protein
MSLRSVRAGTISGMRAGPLWLRRSLGRCGDVGRNTFQT